MLDHFSTGESPGLGPLIFLKVTNFLDIFLILQVMLLLYIANWMVHYMWKKGDDPDNFAIPYLTALGDLFGTGLLAVVFYLL